ncbi:succinate dehydrogenase, cytochrome b556 subunit [Blochmannia endosymbiont of Colobopsis nipponica]|uniref:succinate dehydrogenase, cytochrome b556 subunit n=1 Tax=Blochmannia endosymbiont of Colobopsis nipponica TaxID=2681987 RepID=UPI00177CC6D3|nr:succinate dehydrogenase, cytochrome b556 subunit [Blochmannia endosymbiont of Colobopsis nipponica]QOI11117.1 succinate dehydrogenase, cytochrome b556 subunit [Blochmannia endosymbiont of Colobopsis nipponica]
MNRSTKRQRPINLNLRTMHFPLSAIVSILHRISGVIIFAGTSILLWMLKLSTTSPEGFNYIIFMMQKNTFKVMIWGILTFFTYHSISGMRHVLMDFNYLKQSMLVGKITASIVCLLTIILSIVIGVVIW